MLTLIQAGQVGDDRVREALIKLVNTFSDSRTTTPFSYHALKAHQALSERR
jgi:hypothetical protein